MLTPQEVAEHAFAKASFGGYNMAMVDEFLDALTEDYTALYKENAVLKSKMKVLVDKVEEYRSTEDAMRKALLTAQRLADEMVQEAEEKKTALLAQAEREALAKIASLRAEQEHEARRLEVAQSATTAFVEQMKALCGKELRFLEQVGGLTIPAQMADPVISAAQEIESNLERLTAEEPAPVEEPAAETAPSDAAGDEEDDLPGGLYEDIAASVASEKTKDGMEEVHIEVTLGQPKEAPAPEESAPRRLSRDEEPTQRIDFDHLMFGKDYEIK